MPVGRASFSTARTDSRWRHGSTSDSRFATTTRTGGSRSGGVWRRNPWHILNAIAIGLSLDYTYQDDLRFGVAPVFGWSYETGASASDATNYGAVLSVTKQFSPRLVLGGGVSVFRQIDDTKAFPFVIVQWQIDDRWRLTNPFRAGPAGGAGIELAYAVSDNWEIAGGGELDAGAARFRLDDSGIAPGGIGEPSVPGVRARDAQVGRADNARVLRGRVRTRAHLGNR
jgi:hypothetical protein